MQTIKVKARTDDAGTVRLEITTDLVNQDMEIVLVLNAIERAPVDDMGYPVGYFDDTYGSFESDPLERHQPPQPDVRDALE